MQFPFENVSLPNLIWCCGFLKALREDNECVACQFQRLLSAKGITIDRGQLFTEVKNSLSAKLCSVDKS